MPEITGRPVSLEEILDAREQRAERQRTAREQFPGAALVSFTLNIAGPVKLFALAEQSFQEGCRSIARQFERNRVAVQFYKTCIQPAGCEALWAVDCDPLRLKALMCAVEDGGRLGRLFDIDVLNPEGEILSRTGLGIPRRRCLICDRPARECARSRAHGPELLWHETNRIMREYFTEKRADEIAAMAGKSLLYEVSTTPKPGLVDRANSGAHHDMDLFHFIDSSAALIPHFRQLFLMGVRHAQDSPQRLFGCIRYPGMLAEDAMFAATKGVNTHKGLIFSLGILCAALGYSFANALPCDTGTLLSLCGKMASLSVKQDLDRVTAQNARTFGERLYLQTGSTGIRGEAASGFPSVRHYGLPALRRFMAEGKSLNDAGALTLLTLLGHVEDTNVISRRGLRAAQSVREEAAERMAGEPLPELDEIRVLDQRFIRENISPGGCADLLAITFMLYFLEQEAQDTANGEK